MGNECPSPPDRSLQERYPLPKRYKILRVIGIGASAIVLKCLDRRTEKLVAIKFARGNEILHREAAMMKLLMAQNLDQQNIIKFHKGFRSNSRLVFDMCDISLEAYIEQSQTPMPLQDVRAVIQQMAIAFNALKTIGVIHADLNTNNIMVVDRNTKPLQVKLIDFGLAIHTGQIGHSRIDQIPYFRAPQLMLGLPYTEAVDIWSLGCVMAKMMFKCFLFPGKRHYENLYYIIDLLGLPPDHIINAGPKSSLYFKKTDSNQWVLKTPEEYRGQWLKDNRSYNFRSLEEAKMVNLDAKATEWRECIELLKQMLQWDEKRRITPSKILAHPFITMCYNKNCIRGHTCRESSTKPQTEPCTTKTNTPSMSQTEEACTSKAGLQQERRYIYDNTHKPAAHVKFPIPVSMMKLRSGVILLQPAFGQYRLHSGDTSDEYSTNEERFKSSNKQDDSDPTPASSSSTSSAMTVVDTNQANKEDSESKKKKKKSCFNLFWSWWRRTFSSHRNTVYVADSAKT